MAMDISTGLYGIAYVATSLATRACKFGVKLPATAEEVVKAFGSGSGFRVAPLRRTELFTFEGFKRGLSLTADHMHIRYIQAKPEEYRELEIFEVTPANKTWIEFRFINGRLFRRSHMFRQICATKMGEWEKICALRFRRACLDFLD